jgi:hypothetical protein
VQNASEVIKIVFIYLDIAVKRPPDVRVSKILAGQEADKTNLLLQALAEAINSNVDSNEVVRKTLQNLGETNENEEPSRSREHKDPEPSERRRSKDERSSKSHEREREREREEPPAEKKPSSKETSRVIFILTNQDKFFVFFLLKRIKAMETQVVIQNDDEVLEQLMILLMKKKNQWLYKSKMMTMTMIRR